MRPSLRPLFSYPSSLHHGKSSSTGNLLENDASVPTPDYGLTARLLAQSLAQPRPRPYSMAGFGTQVLSLYLLVNSTISALVTC